MVEMAKERIIQISNDLKKDYMPPGIDKINKRKYKNFEEEYIEKIYNGLLTGNYNFTKYKQLLRIKDKDSKPRLISIPSLRDRLMLKTIHKEFLVDLENRKHVYDLVEEINNLICSGTCNSYIKVDIEKFFNTIDQNLLLDVLRRERLSENVINIIELAIKTNTVDIKKNKSSDKKYTNNCGVPQGIIISNSLAEIYLKYFDDIMTSDKRFYFFRFVDDIIILFDNNIVTIEEISMKLENELENLKLNINKNKTKKGSINDEIEFLGYKFSNKKITVSKDIVEKKEKKIERIIFDYKNAKNAKIRKTKFLQWKLDLEVTGFISNGKHYGWLNTYSSITDLSVLFHLDCCMKKIIKRAGFENSVVPKSFVKYYHIIKNRHLKKITNFDLDYDTIEKKQNFIKDVFAIDTTNLEEDVINDLFSDVVKKTIYDFEKDLDFKYGI